MLVRDAGDAWQIVLQTDHGELAGQFARAWSPRPEPFRSLEVVASRHDDGWFVWEQVPALDGEGRPCSYLDVQVPSHLAFYRAAIAAVTEQDPYAGLILSMHGAGIYRQRYGVQPDLRMTFVAGVQQLADDFVAEQEDAYAARVDELGITDEERWRSYKLLQAWDRLSLYACLNDLAAKAPASPPRPYSSIGAVPTSGDEATLTLHAKGDLRVTVDPYPFEQAEATFSVRRRLVPKREWPDGDAFRADFFAAPVEPVTITMEPA